jgi:hypothetical protein
MVVKAGLFFRRTDMPVRFRSSGMTAQISATPVATVEVCTDFSTSGFTSSTRACRTCKLPAAHQT